MSLPERVFPGRLFSSGANTLHAVHEENAKVAEQFKAKADAKYKEVTTKFPVTRGLKDLQTVLQLIKKLEAVRMAS